MDGEIPHDDAGSIEDGFDDGIIGQNALVSSGEMSDLSDHDILNLAKNLALADAQVICYARDNGPIGVAFT